jgi:hypothetical protein
MSGVSLLLQDSDVSCNLVMDVTCPISPRHSFLGRWIPPKEESMKMSRFTDEQTVAILCEADRTTVADAATKHKVREPKIYA